MHYKLRHHWEMSQNTYSDKTSEKNSSKVVKGEKIRTQYNQTIGINNTNDPRRKNRLRTVSKTILLEGLNRFHGASLTFSTDVDQDTLMFGLHERPLTYPCSIS